MNENTFHHELKFKWNHSDAKLNRQKNTMKIKPKDAELRFFAELRDDGLSLW